MNPVPVRLTINGADYHAEVPLETTLADFVRDTAGLTGTHLACSYEGRCGACTLLADGHAVKSCMLLAVQAEGMDIQTVEGMATRSELHPLQAAFREHHALQCGFCTPGMLATACELVQSDAARTRQSIRRGLVGNICRCTGYGHIVDAIEEVAAAPSADEQEQPKTEGHAHV